MWVFLFLLGALLPTAACGWCPSSRIRLLRREGFRFQGPQNRSLWAVLRSKRGEWRWCVSGVQCTGSSHRSKLAPGAAKALLGKRHTRGQSGENTSAIRTGEGRRSSLGFEPVSCAAFRRKSFSAVATVFCYRISVIDRLAAACSSPYSTSPVE